MALSSGIQRGYVGEKGSDFESYTDDVQPHIAELAANLR